MADHKAEYRSLVIKCFCDAEAGYMCAYIYIHVFVKWSLWTFILKCRAFAPDFYRIDGVFPAVSRKTDMNRGRTGILTVFNS